MEPLICEPEATGRNPRRARAEFIPISESSGTWLVLGTLYPVATQLDLRDRFGLWSYLPLREFRKYANGRLNGWTTEPLFKGYLFVRADDAVVHESRRARLVHSFLPVPDQSKLTRELLAVERVLGINRRVEFVTDFIPGVKVRISDGKFRGFEGFIISKDKRNLFSVEVSVLGGAVMTDVAAGRMELAE
jgi:transcription antitermination factor NusG